MWTNPASTWGFTHNTWHPDGGDCQPAAPFAPTRNEAYCRDMVLAASTFSVIIFVVIVVVLGVLAGGAFNLWGSTSAQHTGAGRRTDDIPGLRKPPDEGGLL